MKILCELVELDSQWQQNEVRPIDASLACIPHGYKPSLVTPKNMSVIERQLYDVDFISHEWRKKYFQNIPNYLAKYFAKRYIQIHKKSGLRVANTFLREKMHPATERLHLVLRQYQNLPTHHKVALLSENFDSDEQSDFRHQSQFDFETAPTAKSTQRNNRQVLAELDIDEIKDMAFRIGKIMLAYQQHLVEKYHGHTEEELDQATLSAYEDMARFVSDHFGFTAPRHRKNQTPITALYDISKMLSEKWWLGRLVRYRKVMREHLAIAMGQVSNSASPYASWDCVREHQEQQKRNWEYIKQCELFDEETEETIPLEDMVVRSVSNPAIRRHELMVRCRGCEDIGNELGLQGLFLTLTTPSQYHNSYKRGGFISHWNGASPRDAQSYLNNVWQKIRAKLNREGIRWFGVRVAEPHHDATPHWHLLIWVQPEDVANVRDIFISYATEKDRGELHPEFEKEKKKPFRKAQYVGPLDYRPRCDLSYIDPEMGTATGYIAKYISKNIDGFAMDGEVSDETGKSVKDMAKNVSAWKSRWNIRQFQFFGGAPVTTYRELRRFANQNKKAFMEYVVMQERSDLMCMYDMLFCQFVGPIKPARLMKTAELIEVIGNSYQARIKSDDTSVVDALKAADNGNWQGYIMGQGGPFVKRKDLLIVNAYELLPFASPHGEDVRKIQGFETPDALVTTRTKVWTIQKKKHDDVEAIALGSEATFIGSSAASRSSVNNCTELSEGQVSDMLSGLFTVENGDPVQFLDDDSLKLLREGRLLQLDNDRSIKIRPAEVDEYGNIVRTPQIVEVRRMTDSVSWLDFESWEDVFADHNDKQSDDDYLQPELSPFLS